MPVESPFAAAERLLAAGDHPRALEVLLGAWREHRAPALGDLIERLSPADVADPVRAAKGTAAHLAAIEALTAGPPDPRVAAALCSELEKPRYTAQSGKPTWRLIFAQLGDRHADPRTLARLERLLPEYRFVFGATVMAEWMIGQMTKLAEALRARFPAPPVMDDPAFARLVSPAPAPPSPSPPARREATEADLLRDVAADPDADEPRLVFADWLLERGDPRGELITLQMRRHRGEALAAAEEKREAALITQHARSWLGPLASCTEGWRFERGFLAACALRGKKFPADVVDHPLWATVEELSVGRRGKTSDRTAAGIVTAPALRRVRRLLDVPAVVLEAVVTAAEPWPRLVDLVGSDYEPEYVGGDQPDPPSFPPKLWKALVAGEALPALKSLTLVPRMHDNAHLAAADLWTGPLVKRLRRVEIRYLRPWDVPRWYADLRGKVRGLDLVLDLWGWTFRPEAGEPSQLEIGRCGDVSAVVSALAALPADALTSLVVSTPLAAQAAARIEAVAARFPRLRRLEAHRA